MRFHSRALTGLAALIAASHVAAAAPAWQPSRPVELVVSTSAGSGSDTTARFVGNLYAAGCHVRSRGRSVTA